MLRRLKRYMDYNPDTGLVDFKDNEVVLLHNGYMRVKIKGKTYKVSDLCYQYVNGELPAYTNAVQVNGNKLDFRISNLRLDTSKIKQREYKERYKREKEAKEDLKQRKLKTKPFL